MPNDVLDAEMAASGRGTVEILPGGRLRVGGLATRFDVGVESSLLQAYLVAVRTLRRQRREPAIVLRSDDVSVLAAYLGQPASQVIDRLGALMGATRTQRAAMAAMFATGVLVIGLATSAAGVASDAGRGPVMESPAESSTTTSVWSDEHAGAASTDARVVVFVDREHDDVAPSSTTTTMPPVESTQSEPVDRDHAGEQLGTPSGPAPGASAARSGPVRTGPTPTTPATTNPTTPPTPAPEASVPETSAPETTLPTTTPPAPSVGEPETPPDGAGDPGDLEDDDLDDEDEEDEEDQGPWILLPPPLLDPVPPTTTSAPPQTGPDTGSGQN